MFNKKIGIEALTFESNLSMIETLLNYKFNFPIIELQTNGLVLGGKEFDKYLSLKEKSE